MSPMMRERLSRVIQYHEEMRDYHLAQDAEAKSSAKRSDQPKPPSAAAKLAEMHDDVVAQLQAVVDAVPLLYPIERTDLPQRNLTAGKRPSAGVFH